VRDEGVAINTLKPLVALTNDSFVWLCPFGCYALTLAI